MRQAGIIAKFGEVSLDTMISQIEEDHQNAVMLAEGLHDIESINIDLNNLHSNILYFQLDENKTKLSKPLVKIMEEREILFFEVSPNRYRLVTHYGINSEHIKKVLTTFNEIL